MGDPVTGVKPALWGVPVILSEAMTENTAMVANLAIAATAYVRQAPVVEVAPYGGGTTEFITNQTLIRAEERLALAVHHPTAILHRHGDLRPARRACVNLTAISFSRGQWRKQGKRGGQPLLAGDIACARTPSAL